MADGVEASLGAHAPLSPGVLPHCEPSTVIASTPLCQMLRLLVSRCQEKQPGNQQHLLMSGCCTRLCLTDAPLRAHLLTQQHPATVLGQNRCKRPSVAQPPWARWAMQLSSLPPRRPAARGSNVWL